MSYTRILDVPFSHEYRYEYITIKNTERDEFLSNIRTTCFSCKAVAKMESCEHVGLVKKRTEPRQIGVSYHKNDDLYLTHINYHCNLCNELITVRYKGFIGEDETDIGFAIVFPNHKENSGLKVLEDYLTEEIYDDYDEAVFNLDSNCIKSSAIMFRRTLEGIIDEYVDDEDVMKEKWLNQKIKAMKIDEGLKGMIDQIKIFGNWGAHNQRDKDKKLSRDDIVMAKTFIERFVEYYIIFPEKLRKDQEKINEDSESNGDEE